MPIRYATMDDIPACIAMGRKFFERTAYAPFGYDETDARAVLAALLEEDHGALIVAERDRLVGMLGLIAVPLYMNKTVLLAQELFWWSEAPGAGIAMLRFGEAWAKQLGAHAVLMLALDEVQGARVGEMYQRQGYTPAERYFRKVM